MASQDPDCGEKIAAIQLLRGLAAGTVALAHLMWAYADHIGAGLGFSLDMGRAAQGAVMLFFVISGYVMVTASRRQFGMAGARRIFWTRRAVRILPPYWIATAAFVAASAWALSAAFTTRELALSLALIPYWPEAGIQSLRALPVLWVGWTLFYELVFYCVFGLFVGYGRTATLAGSAAVLITLVALGTLVGSANAFVWMLTRPVLVMFLVGMGLAILREQRRILPLALRGLALAGALAAWWLIPRSANADALGFDYLAWCGVPAGLIAIAVMGGRTALPFPALQNAAGDVSYALYLLHLPVAVAWLGVFVRTPLVASGAWGYLLSAGVLVLAVSWLFHTRIEAPMTRALNRGLSATRQRPSARRT